MWADLYTRIGYLSIFYAWWFFGRYKAKTIAATEVDTLHADVEVSPDGA